MNIKCHFGKHKFGKPKSIMPEGFGFVKVCERCGYEVTDNDLNMELVGIMFDIEGRDVRARSKEEISKLLGRKVEFSN